MIGIGNYLAEIKSSLATVQSGISSSGINQFSGEFIYSSKVWTCTLNGIYRISALGAGGSGSVYVYSSNGYTTYGGGGGGFSEIDSEIHIGNTLTITIGSGGLGCTTSATNSGATGNSGGNTTVYGSSISLSAGGGGGGRINSAAGVGGTASGGTINITGGAGGTGTTYAGLSSSAAIGGCSATPYGSGANGIISYYGVGVRSSSGLGFDSLINSFFTQSLSNGLIQTLGYSTLSSNKLNGALGSYGSGGTLVGPNAIIGGGSGGSFNNSSNPASTTSGKGGDGIVVIELLRVL